MKKLVVAMCVLIGMVGVIMLFSETPETAPLSEQVWLWVKGLALIVVAVVIGGFVSENEEVKR